MGTHVYKSYSVDANAQPLPGNAVLLPGGTNQREQQRLCFLVQLPETRNRQAWG